jgi:hypothetical protein
VEELGPALAPIAVLGTYHDVPAVTGTIVTPLIGHLPGVDLSDPSAVLAANAAEVDAAFTLPLTHLVDPRNVKGYWEAGEGNSGPAAGGGAAETSRAEAAGRAAGHPRKGLRIPIYEGGPVPIWGLTAYLLEGILRDVIVPAFEDAGLRLK